MGTRKVFLSMRQGIVARGLVVALASAVLTAFAAAQPATATSASPLRHAIVFSFFPPGADLGEVYRIDAGGSVEEPIHDVFDAALLSPDGTQFLDFAPAPNDRGTTGIFNVDGSGYRVLPPDPSFILPGGVWSLGGTRIVTEAFDPTDGTSVGLYSRRASDGGGLIRLTNAGSRRDYPAQSSPDGRKVAFFRPDAPKETSDSAAQDLYVVGVRGGGLTRLTPSGYTTGVPFSYDSISWAPDGHSVTVVAAHGGFWSHPSRSVYIANVDGSTFTRVGPSGDIWEAVWSPDGRWIALTMAAKTTGGLHELYLMHPDGSCLHALTGGAEGWVALRPTWSPDSSQLLFTRGTGDPNVGDLWSVDVDGSHLHRITHEPGGYRAAAWIP